MQFKDIFFKTTIKPKSTTTTNVIQRFYSAGLTYHLLFNIIFRIHHYIALRYLQVFYQRPSTVVKITNSGANIFRFTSSTFYLTSLCFSFFTCKMGKFTTPISWYVVLAKLRLLAFCYSDGNKSDIWKRGAKLLYKDFLSEQVLSTFFCCSSCGSRVPQFLFVRKTLFLLISKG